MSRENMSLEEMSAEKKKYDNKLVYMANQIGKFFQSQGKDAAVAGIADHIKSFWDPRMRAEIFKILDQGGEGIDPLVKQALTQIRP